MIHNNINICIFWFQSEMYSWSWLVWSYSERCALAIWQEWHVTFNYLFFMKTECCWIKLWDLWQEIAYDNMMLWTMMIRTWRINVSHEDSNRSQESAVFHDHKAIDTLTDMMSWVLVIIWFQDHISIWQARSEVWCAHTMITRLAHKLRWWMNSESISDSVASEMI